MMTSFDYKYQNAFRCNLCYADSQKKNTEYNSLPQSIMIMIMIIIIITIYYYYYSALRQAIVFQPRPQGPPREKSGGPWGQG